LTEGVSNVSWVLAFLAGVISFLSPCVLPLIPGYISLVTKLTCEELTGDTKKGKTKQIMIPTVFFVLGFSVVFVLLGASASFFGSLLHQNRIFLLKLSGVVIILFGLFTMDLFKLPQLYKEWRLNLPQANLGYIGTFLLGIAFGFGWTPCVGPILASILLYASTAEAASKGAALLFVYSAGLGLPFLLTGIAISSALSTFSWIKRHYGYYKITVGGTLMIVGIMMVTNNLYYLNIYGQKVLDLAGIDFWKGF